MGVAIESAIEWGIDKFSGKDQFFSETYLRGDWVIVDEGQKTTKEVDRDIVLGMSEMFDDAPTLSEIHTLVRVEDFHIGFYVSPGNAFGTVTVFDLLTGDTVEHFMVNVRKLPVARRGALDNDPYAGAVLHEDGQRETGLRGVLRTGHRGALQAQALPHREVRRRRGPN